MKTIVEDDRNEETRITHNCIILATDRFLSGWGLAEGGNSYAAWACKSKDFTKVLRWVKSRSDMMRIREVSTNYRPSQYCAHLHIYVVNDNHPSLQ